MKHKVEELEGALLDAAVRAAWGDPTDDDLWMFGLSFFDELKPSTNWRHGGPIIEREHIAVWWRDDSWHAAVGQISGWDDGSIVGDHECSGPTALIAAMRACCAKIFGEAVELPDA